MNRIHLSGVVICQDNEATIGAVIDSLTSVCDEVVVVDGGSTDATIEVARSSEKVRLYERDFDNYAAQKNFACDRARGDWILILDSDELIGARGAARLRWLTHVPGMSWYSLPRYWLVYVEGELYYLAERPWYRDRQLRLFRNDQGFRYDEIRTPVHEEFREKHGWGRPLRNPHIYHYALVLQCREQREKKFRRYMEINPALQRIHRQQLWEDANARLERLPEPPPRMIP